MFILKPILNLKDDGCISNLIKIGSINILFECGFDDDELKDFGSNHNSYNKINAVFEEILTNNEIINYCFISDCSLKCFGFLPLIIKLFPEVEIYSSTPIAKIGYFLLLDYLSTYSQFYNFHLFNEEEIYNSFNNIEEYNYNSQISIMNGNLTLEPLPSGHSIGGIIWKIKYLVKTIIYSPFISTDKNYNSKPVQFEKLKDSFLLITEDQNLYLSDVKGESLDKIHRNLFEFNKHILNRLFFNKKHLFFPLKNFSQSLQVLSLIREIISEVEEDNSYLNKIPRSEQQLKRNFYICLFGSYVNEVDESLKSLENWTSNNYKHHNFDINNEENRHTVTNESEYSIITKGFNTYDGLISYLKQQFILYTANDPKKAENVKFSTIIDALIHKGHIIIFLPFGNGIVNLSEWSELIGNLLKNTITDTLITFKPDCSEEDREKRLFIPQLSKSLNNANTFTMSYNNRKRIVEEIEINMNKNTSDIKINSIEPIKEVIICKNFRINQFKKFKTFSKRQERDFDFGTPLNEDELLIIKSNIQLKESEPEHVNKETIFEHKGIFYKSEFEGKSVQFNLSNKDNMKFIDLSFPNINNFQRIIKMISPRNIILLGSESSQQHKSLAKSIIPIKNYPEIVDLSVLYSNYYQAYIEVKEDKLENNHNLNFVSEVQFLKVKRDQIKICSRDEFYSELLIKKDKKVHKLFTQDTVLYPSVVIINENENFVTLIDQKTKNIKNKEIIVTNSDEIVLNGDSNVCYSHTNSEISISSTFGSDYFKIRKGLLNK